MPYGRRTYRKRRTRPYRKRGRLAPKSIRRRTGARAQSRQILSLSRRVRAVTKNNYEMVSTQYQRNMLPIGNAGATYTAYVCPLPYAPCDVFGTSPVPYAQRFGDNRSIASQPFMQKQPVFGSSQAARNSNLMYHSGSTLKWVMQSTEPSLSKITLMLIKPKKAIADSLTVDRQLDGIASGGTAPGTAAELTKDIDFTHFTASAGLSTGSIFGGKMNPKYWNTLYRREVTLGSLDGTSINTNVTGSNTSPAQNALTAAGTIKIPAGGKILSSGELTQMVASTATNAWEYQVVDQKNENCCYLVALLNDTTSDLEQIKLGFQVVDRYKVIV